MAFTEQQCQALKAKLSYRNVKTKVSHGATIAYVAGWHVIAEANRIFGYDAWDRTTLSPRCLWSDVQRDQLVCFYATKVRVTVRAGGTVTVREGIGTGIGRSLSPEVAHEMGLKAAETDATKRALATFGNPFGLALYDKDHNHVTRRGKRAVLTPAPQNQHGQPEPGSNLKPATSVLMTPTPLSRPHSRRLRDCRLSTPCTHSGSRTFPPFVPCAG